MEETADYFDFPSVMSDVPFPYSPSSTENLTELLSNTSLSHMWTNNYTNLYLAKALFQAKLFRIGYGYVLFSICFAGVCGNLLVFCVLTRKAMRTSTTAVYLQVLAVTDTLVLVTAIFRYKSYKMFMSNDTDAVFYFDPYVEVYVEPFFWIFLGVSSFVTLLLSTERYLAVKYPLTIKRICTVELVIVCIIAVIFITTVITVPMFFNFEVRHTTLFHNISTVAVYPTSFGLTQHYFCTYTHYILPLVWYMCPWVVMAVVNTLLAIHVRRSVRIRVGVPNVTNPNRNLSVLIILVVIIYMVCNFPACIISLMNLFNNKHHHCLKETRSLGNPDYSNTYLISLVVAHILTVLNSCVNIFVYCLVGSKFRKELKKLILCEPCHKHTTVHINNTIHVTLTRDTTDSVPRDSPPLVTQRQV